LSLASDTEMAHMTLDRTEDFRRWLDDLHDDVGHGAILNRLDRLKLGNAGDAGPVGDGMMEIRIHVGPGYRVYYKVYRRSHAVVYWAGKKATQRADVKKAKRLAAELEE
jgi:putative addiction module killer protein